MDEQERTLIKNKLEDVTLKVEEYGSQSEQFAKARETLVKIGSENMELQEKIKMLIEENNSLLDGIKESFQNEILVDIKKSYENDCKLLDDYSKQSNKTTEELCNCIKLFEDQINKLDEKNNDIEKNINLKVEEITQKVKDFNNDITNRMNSIITDFNSLKNNVFMLEDKLLSNYSQIQKSFSDYNIYFSKINKKFIYLLFGVILLIALLILVIIIK